MTAPLLVLDAPSLYFRAFFGVPPRHAPDGMLVNAAAGFVDWLARLVASRDPGRIACCMDYDWRPAWRVALLASYKTHRVAPDASTATGGAPPGGSGGQSASAASGPPAQQAEPPELGPQVPIIVEAMRAVGVAVVGLDEFEADDVIATLAHREAPPVEIVTGDRDLFQLVRDPDVKVLYPRRGVTEMEQVDEAYVAAKYHIPGRAYADFSILRGDSSDGLPGVRGIGERTAATLVTRYGSLEAIEAAALERATGPLANVKASLEYLEAAKRVVRLRADLPVADQALTRPTVPADPEAVSVLAKRYGIAGPLKRLVDAIGRIG